MLPLHSLLALLQAHGLHPDLPAQVRLQALLQLRGGELLAKGGEEEMRELALLLAPVVAKNLAEQELFYQVFKEYWLRLVLPEAKNMRAFLSQPIDNEGKEGENEGKENEDGKSLEGKNENGEGRGGVWLKFGVAALLTLLLLVAYLVWKPEPDPILIDENNPEPEVACNPPSIQNITYNLGEVLQGKETAFSAQTSPAPDSLWVLWNFGEGRAQSLCTSSSQLLEKGKEHTVNVRAIRKADWEKVVGEKVAAQAEPTPEQLGAVLDTINSCLKAEYKLPLRTTLTLPDLAPEELVKDDKGMPFFTQKAGWILAFFCLILWILAELAIWTTRRQRVTLGKSTDLVLGEYPPLELPFPNRESKLQREPQMAELAAGMRLRQRGERSYLDIGETIRASISSGGMPRLRYRHNTEPTEYLLLIEGEEVGSFQNLAALALASFLKKQEVFLDVYTLRQGKAFSPSFPQGKTLDRLWQECPKHRLLFMGSGHNLLHPRRASLVETTEKILRRWPDRLLLTPTPMTDWGYREERLSQLFQVMPHTWQGILQGVRWQHEENTVLHRRVRELAQKLDLLPSMDETDWHSPDALRKFLGNAAFAALCMAQVYAMPRWEVALAMLATVHGKWEDAFALSRVPWLQEGLLPTQVRLALLQALTPEQERQARACLLGLLEEAGENLPPDAFSKREFEEQHALNAFLLSPEDPEKAATAYQLWQQGRPADTPLRLHLEARPGLLPDTAQKFFYKRFAPIIKTHLAWRAVAAILLGIGIWATLRSHDGTPKLEQWDKNLSLQPKDLVQYPVQEDSLASINNAFVAILRYLQTNPQGNNKISAMEMDDTSQQGTPAPDAYAFYKEADAKFANALSAILPTWVAQTARLDTVHYNQNLLHYNWGRSLYQRRQWEMATERFAHVQHPRLRNEALHARGLCAIYANNLDLARQLADSLPIEFWETHKPNLLDLLPKTNAELAFRAKHANDLRNFYLEAQKRALEILQKAHSCATPTLTKTDTASLYTNEQGGQLQASATYTYNIDCQKEGAWQTTVRTVGKLNADGRVSFEGTDIKEDKQTRPPSDFPQGGLGGIAEKDSSSNDPKGDTLSPSDKVRDDAQVSPSGEMSEEQRGAIRAALTPMVLVKSGIFTMGSPTTEADRNGDETQHEVTLSSYYIGKFEVTQKLWKAVMGENPSYFKDCDDCPVEQVSWDDIQEFLKKLNAATGQTYRLPTEAEWEFAARAGTTTPFYTGNNLTTSQANYSGNYPYNGNAKGEYRKKTTPVGSFNANAFGLYDMHGNVYEWCSDWYDEKYYASSPSNNPQGPTSSPDGYRVLRGGSWLNDAQLCRSADRYRDYPVDRYADYGFRLALVP